jgi:hypothetical protein
MTIEVLPKLEYVCVLSDGTKIVRNDKEGIIQHIWNKLQTNINLTAYYSKEIGQLDSQSALLRNDLEAAKAIKD